MISTRLQAKALIFLGLALTATGCVTTSTPPAPAPTTTDCPQPKFTGRAPEEFFNRKNPLANADLKLGEKLYFDDAPGRYSCATCHGRNGDGRGPGDLKVRFDLAHALIAEGEYEQALEHLLEIIRTDRKWNEEAGRKHLLTLFEAMGPTDPRTIEARRRLSGLLFS